MKGIRLFSIVSIVVLSFLFACSKENNTVASKVEKKSAKPIISESVVVTPEAVGVSGIKSNFTPFSKCDGGECLDIDFTVGIKIPQGEKATFTYFKDLHFSSYSSRAGDVKKAPEIVKGKLLYNTLRTINSQKITVTLVGNRITKITKKEEWKGKTFTPEEVLWEEK